MLRRLSPWLFLTLAFLAAFLLTWRDYGASYDEPGLYRYAREARQAYALALRGDLDFNYSDPIQKHYGPAFFIAASYAAEALAPLGWGEPDRWHFVYGLFFLLSLAALYQLARRWFSGWSALALTILFASQPLVWGHAFMNPKDPPFLGFMLLTLLLGLNLADRAAARAPQTLAAENARPAWRALLLTLTGLWGAFFVLRGLAQLLIVFLLRLAAFNPSLPPENYLKKLTIWGLWLSAALTVCALAFYLPRLLPPVREFFFWLFRPQTVLAAAALGVTVSLRLTAGLLALTLAAIFVWRLRWRALPLLLAYALLAAAALLLAWPFLWLNPLKNLLKSLAVMLEFSRPGAWYDYPRLLAWQWSEPALALMLLGLLLLLARRATFRAEFLFIFFGLSLTPIAALAVSANLLYDNFRQFFFVWPGFFLLTGFAFEALFRRLKRAPLRLTLILLTAGVGWLAIVQLRPYEYTYYNHLAGGPSGAARRHLPGDYWNLSLREAANFLNQNAPAAANILTCGAVDSLKMALRPGLSAVYGCDETTRAGFDYAVVTSPLGGLPRPFDALPAEFVVQRQGVIFARVIRLPAP